MVPIYEQLMEQIKSDIIQSVLSEGEALPSVRRKKAAFRTLFEKRPSCLDILPLISYFSNPAASSAIMPSSARSPQ